MSLNRLKIVSVHNKESSDQKSLRPRTNRQEVQARFETMWHRTPEKFDPLKDCMERERFARTLAMIDKLPSLKDKKIVDLGCGTGALSRKLRDIGAQVTAVDIAKNALEKFHKVDDENITLIHDCIPHTKLEDGSFDIVICTDLIGYIKSKDHRLFISELARLVKKDGYVVCSAPIDIYSEDALEKFFTLAETELDIVHCQLSYHSYYLKWLNFLKAPACFAKGRKDQAYRKEALSKRHHLGRWWYKINSAPFIGDIWRYLQYFFRPIYSWIKQSRVFMIYLEKICRILSSEAGVSHAIFIAQRRPLMNNPPIESHPLEMKTKKSVWE